MRGFLPPHQFYWFPKLGTRSIMMQWWSHTTLGSIMSTRCEWYLISGTYKNNKIQFIQNQKSRCPFNASTWWNQNVSSIKMSRVGRLGWVRILFWALRWVGFGLIIFQPIDPTQPIIYVCLLPLFYFHFDLL